MIKFLLLLAALGFFGTSSVYAQKRSARDSTDALVRDNKRMAHVVDSLKNLCMDQNDKLEGLKKKLSSAKKAKTRASAKKASVLKKDVKREETRFEMLLTQLDSCTGVLQNLNSRLAKAQSAHKH